MTRADAELLAALKRERNSEYRNRWFREYALPRYETSYEADTRFAAEFQKLAPVGPNTPSLLRRSKKTGRFKKASMKITKENKCA